MSSDFGWISGDPSLDPACVEVAAARSTVHVRDSKGPAGPQLGFTSVAWADFVPYASGS